MRKVIVNRTQTLREILGGLLMGLANLVPGISGGTMLLAVGVYPRFIEGIAEVTTFRFRLRTLSTLATIGGAATIAIITGAGIVRELVIDHRWVMFSLFVGLTLGGVPVIWRLMRPITATTVCGCIGGLTLTILLVFLQPSTTEPVTDSLPYLMLFLAGLGGASAMVLPGISGGYVLLILGQYLTILETIDETRKALTDADGPQWGYLLEASHIFLPVAMGVALGLVVISNLLKFFLEYFKKQTLGVLLGFLIGAVVGLWPFQHSVTPDPGDVIKGQVMTSASITALDPGDFPVQRFTPNGGQFAGSVGLIVGGFLLTQMIALIGNRETTSKDVPQGEI
ncbi:MAG: hypothetical protein CMN58_08460 [Solibacterales bacterium]|nr:hypothetical protein [Bryobacterales bacterium]